MKDADETRMRFLAGRFYDPPEGGLLTRFVFSPLAAQLFQGNC